MDADEALFVRTQSLVHWDVACVWSQTRCLTKCETITSLGMCGVCQKDNVTLSRRLLCKYSWHLSALLLISLVNAVNAAGVEDVLPENVSVSICFLSDLYVFCKDIINKHIDCLNNRRKRTIRKKRGRRGTWRAVSPPGWFPWHCQPLPPGQQVVGENTKWNEHKYKKYFAKLCSTIVVYFA